MSGNTTAIQQLTGDAQTVFVILLGIAHRGETAAHMAHDAPARLLTDVAVVLEACAEQLRRGTGTPPIDLDEALASVERDLHAAGAREDGAGEAVLYRELVLAVNRLAHGDSKALKIGAR